MQPTEALAWATKFSRQLLGVILKREEKFTHVLPAVYIYVKDKCLWQIFLSIPNLVRVAMAGYFTQKSFSFQTRMLNPIKQIWWRLGL